MAISISKPIEAIRREIVSYQNEINSLAARSNALVSEKAECERRLRELQSELIGLQSDLREIQNAENRIREISNEIDSISEGQWNGGSDSVTDTENASAAIDSYYAESMDWAVGELVTLYLTFRNKADSYRILYGALSIREPNGKECNFGWVYSQLAPNEAITVEWDYYPGQAGSYDVVFGVWNEFSVSLSNSGWVENYFTVGGAEDSFVPDLAYKSDSKELTLTEGSKIFSVVDGNTVSSDEFPVAPYNQDGMLYIPFRKVIESLGGIVDWVGYPTASLNGDLTSFQDSSDIIYFPGVATIAINALAEKMGIEFTKSGDGSSYVLTCQSRIGIPEDLKAVLAVCDDSSRGNIYDFKGRMCRNFTTGRIIIGGIDYFSADNFAKAMGGSTSCQTLVNGKVKCVMKLDGKNYVFHSGSSIIEDSSGSCLGMLDANDKGTVFKVVNNVPMLPASFFFQYLGIGIIDTSGLSNAHVFIQRFLDLADESPEFTREIFVGILEETGKQVVYTDNIALILQKTMFTESKARVIRGSPENFSELIATVGLDLIVIGDILDISRQGHYYIIGSDEWDPLVAGLAIFGILTTAAPIGDETVSLTKTGIKLLNKAGKIDKAIIDPFKKAFKIAAKNADLGKLKSLVKVLQNFGSNSRYVTRLAEYLKKYGDEGMDLIGGVGRWIGKNADEMKFGDITYHFEKHASDGIKWFGRKFDNTDEYLKAAREVINNPNAKKVMYYYWDNLSEPRLGYFVEKKGKVFFASIDDKGFINTFFVPDDGLDYLKTNAFAKLLELP